MCVVPNMTEEFRGDEKPRAFKQDDYYAVTKLRDGELLYMMQKWHNADIPSATNVTFPFTTSEDTKKEVLHAQDWWSAWKGWTEAEQFRANGGTTTVRICVCDVIQMMQSYSVEIPNIGAKSCSIVCTDPCFHLPTPTK